MVPKGPLLSYLEKYISENAIQNLLMIFPLICQTKPPNVRTTENVFLNNFEHDHQTGNFEVFERSQIVVNLVVFHAGSYSRNSFICHRAPLVRAFCDKESNVPLIVHVHNEGRRRLAVVRGRQK